MQKLVFLIILTFSMSAHSNCLDLYKNRASWKEQRAKKDRNAYNRKQAKMARRKANLLGGIISGNSKDADLQVWRACTGMFIAPGMKDGEANADLYCVRPMLKTYPGFRKYIAKKNRSKDYCKEKDLGWFKKKLRGERNYPPTEFNFYLGKEFSHYFFKVYRGN